MEGKEIRRLRRGLGWTQETLAEFLALPNRAHIGAIENGRKGARRLTTQCLEALERVCQATRPEARQSLQRRPMEETIGWFCRVLAAGAGLGVRP